MMACKLGTLETLELSTANRWPYLPTMGRTYLPRTHPAASDRAYQASRLMLAAAAWPLSR